MMSFKFLTQMPVDILYGGVSTKHNIDECIFVAISFSWVKYFNKLSDIEHR